MVMFSDKALKLRRSFEYYTGGPEKLPYENRHDRRKRESIDRKAAKRTRHGLTT
jgi:hypothetical protein